MPRQLFNKKYGEEALYQDAIDIVLPEAYTKALDESGIEPVDRPEIDIESIEKGQPVVFTAKVTVKPEVKLGDYKGLEVTPLEETVTEIELTPEQIAMNEWLEDYRTLQASLKLKDVAVATNQPVSAEEEAMIQTLAEKVRTNQKPEYVKFI
jgi:trigger factor